MKSLHFLLLERSSRDLFKNEVLDRNFDFEGTPYPLNVSIFFLENGPKVDFFQIWGWNRYLYLGNNTKKYRNKMYFSLELGF